MAGPEYVVIWRVELDADSPYDAARQARNIQLDPESAATLFEVIDSEGQRIVDLEYDWIEEDEGEDLPTE